MALVTAAAILAILLLALLLGLTGWQNRDLGARLRGTGRPPRQVLARALRLWSPLGAAIVAGVLLAHLLATAATTLVHRFTPLDDWCVVANADGQPTVPCSGLAGELPASAWQRVPQRESTASFALERYAAAMDALLATPGREPPSPRALRPSALLGLPEGPLEDSELRRMRRELRELLDAPAAPATSPLDLLRARGDAQIRTRRLRELTAQVRARQDALDRAAYAGLPPAEQGRRWLQHRLAHRLLLAQWPEDSLRRVAATRAEADAGTTLRRAGLAMDAAATLRVLAREDATAKSRAALALAWPVPPRCRFAGGPDVECPRVTGTTIELQRLPARESVRLSLDRWRGQARRESLRVLGEAGLEGRRGVESAQRASSALPRALRRQLFPDRADCALARPADCAGGWLNAALERALTPGSDWSAATLRRADDAFEWRLAQAVAPAWSRIDVIHDRATALALDGLRLHALARIAGWLLLAFLAIKSFLYVLGLEAFRHGGPQVLGLSSGPSVQGVVRVGRRLTLDPDFHGALVTHRQLSNSDNHLRLAPWPGAAPIARLLHGRYLWFTRGVFLSADTGPGGALGRIASADAGQAIVEWRMRPGEQVVFGWRHFFGASENLHFHTRLSLRLSTLLLGRVLFRVAHCPADAQDGVLLLRADVEQVEPAQLHAVPPERLLAWNAQARFRAHGAHTAWGVLVHGLTLVREPAAGGIVITSSEDGGPRFGSLRFLRRLFNAIF